MLYGRYEDFIITAWSYHCNDQTQAKHCKVESANEGTKNQGRGH